MEGPQITEQGIFIGGKKTQLISGSLHYFRVLPEYWEDRLKKLLALGCNTVDTYVAWNVHERREGEFDFSGRSDFARFLDLAASLGLYAVVRPGPYICSEWDMGGLPWWLLRYDLSLRSSDPVFLQKTARYMAEVCKHLAPRQITRGGNVIFVQLENEYGNYGNDKAYLRALMQCLRENGIEVPLFTSDSEMKILLDNGTLPEVWKTVNYRTDSQKSIGALKRYQPDLPAGVGELWNGRAMHWAHEFAPREVAPIAETVKKALELADYVNLYMFHGGTNFGLMNGAVFDAEGKFTPQLSSYDVDAPLSECGECTPKYYAEQAVICAHTGKEVPPPGEKVRLRAYGEAAFEGFAGVFDCLGEIAGHGEYVSPPSMEQAGQGHGCIVYSAAVTGSAKGGKLLFPKIGDAAEVFVDGRHIASLYRSDGLQTVEVPPCNGMFELKVLVSNLGRINFGYHLYDRKGIVGNVAFIEPEYCGMKIILSHWAVDTVEFDRLPRQYGGFRPGQPGFYRYSFVADAACDTFVRADGFTRGCVFVNGFLLGRHWNVGPQKTLYVPAPLLHAGENEIIVFDEAPAERPGRVLLTDRHVLTELTLPAAQDKK